MNAAKARIPTRWFRYKKDKVDICNLCLQKRRLSNDHIPPQGSTQIEEVEVQSLFGFLADDRERPTFIQNGLKYRTLCRDCNSLVGKYDRELNRFSNYIRACVKASIVIPDRMSFTGRPNAIIRALAGHLVAAKLQPDEVAFDQEARKIVFDKDLPIPDKWEVYYWVFPFTSTIVIRDVIIMLLGQRGKKYMFTQLIKYFPIAFMICDNDQFLLSSLTVAKQEKCQYQRTLIVDLAQRIGEHWPEAPADDRAIFMGDAGVRSARAVQRAARYSSR